MWAIWLTAGLGLILYTVLLIRTQPFHLGMVVPAAASVPLVGLALAPPGSALSTLCALALIAICIGFAALLLLLGLGCRNRLTREDVPGLILVVGYALHKGDVTKTLALRLDTAITLAGDFPEARILVTGGAPRSGPAEAQRMREYLLDHGIRESRIVTEERSRSSYENLLHCRSLWEEMGRPACCLVTSCYHVLRTLWTARHVQFPMAFVPAPVPCGLFPVEAAREGILLLKTALFGFASMAWANGRL